MKAAVVALPGQAPVFADFAEPVVPAGRELVDLVAAGIHPLVRALASGAHYGSSGAWPMIPGIDAVARTSVGSLVYTGYVMPPYGTLAERMAVPSGGMELPAGADPIQVAGGINPGLSSWLPLQSRLAELAAEAQPETQAEAQRLGTVLVLGATGVAGYLAVQNALVLGAQRVVAAGRDAHRLERAAELGAATVQLTGDQEADAAALITALGGTAPGIVLDYVWGTPAQAAFAALARQGLDEDDADIAYLQLGSLAGDSAALPAQLLRARRIRVSGSGAGSASLAQIMTQLPVYLQLITDGTIRVPVQAFSLAEVTSAWASGSDVRAVVTP